jgi:hypothetical protein
MMAASMVRFTCPQCRCFGEQAVGAVNRAAKRGAPVYCGRECAGLARRGPEKSPEQRKAEKSAYDAKRRVAIADRLKAEKRAYHLRTYDPVKAAVERKKRMPKHVEYCRRPDYVAWKREYDRQYRAREYGEFSDCYLLVMDIRNECLSQQSDYEIRMSKGTFGKCQQRKRDYDRLDREEPEIGPLGNLERGEKW